MFGVLKIFAWIIIILALTYFAMPYFGYKVNLDYFKQSKSACEQRLKECSSSLIHKGIDNVECDFVCVSPDLIIKEK